MVLYSIHHADIFYLKPIHLFYFLQTTYYTVNLIFPFMYIYTLSFLSQISSNAERENIYIIA